MELIEPTLLFLSENWCFRKQINTLYRKMKQAEIFYFPACFIFQDFVFLTAAQKIPTTSSDC